MTAEACIRRAERARVVVKWNMGGLKRGSEYTAVVHMVSGCKCSRCRHFVIVYTLKVYGIMKINLENNVTLCAVVSWKSQLWQYCFSPRINSWFLEIHRVRPALDSVISISFFWWDL